MEFSLFFSFCFSFCIFCSLSFVQEKERDREKKCCPFGKGRKAFIYRKTGERGRDKNEKETTFLLAGSNMRSQETELVSRKKNQEAERERERERERGI